ncbi:MAG: hypothetical protein LUE29_00695 [Lachnospiraceae bacterium]|nr:hypothetical protein [Lachnospiraceae bacterium]
MKRRICDCCRKIFFLPAWLTALIAVPAFAALIFFLYGRSMEPFSILEIPIYCLSAYALVISCTGAGRAFSRIRKRLQSYAFWKKWREDVRLRTMVTMTPGLLLNGLYVFTNIGMGVLNHTAWFIYLGGYYFLLTAMKSSLLYDLAAKRGRRDARGEWQKYRNCGRILLLLNVVLIAECVYIVYKKQSYHYDGMLIYAMAAMAFYSLISAIVHLIRYRKYKSPVLSAVKVINLTTAMVTMLALETAMIAQFGGEGQENFRRNMTSMTAAVVCAVELVMAVFMIYCGRRRKNDMTLAS